MVLVQQKIKDKCIAIVCFGPLTDTTGFQAGAFYQVLIDPQRISPCGKFIQFIQDDVCQLHGWQRVDALTICSVLSDGQTEIPKNDNPITMRAVP